VNMPGKDGHALAGALRALGWQQTILMVSAEAQQPVQRDDSLAPYNEYLVKPINNQQLVERIGHWLKLEWTYADPPSPMATAGQVTPKPTQLAKAEAGPLPDHALLRELLAHAQIGYRQGVQTKLDEIAAFDDLIDAGTLENFRELAARMQFAQLATALERDLT
ncbi:MAG TPA: response regulator, partial [Candidatus Acidoferrum sp.]|nr:response regulator [Candidatus Acidoferrum sp.]